jgi:two-component system OmpR family response regulator
VKALIIDDEIDICYLLSGILRNKNIQPNYVNTIGDAVNALEKHQPQIVFLDNHLPDGMGVDLIRNIKLLLPNAKLVMITAYDTAADRNRAMAEGADFFISKPFSRDTIYQITDQLVH